MTTGAPHRIIAVSFDTETIAPRSPDIEMERHRAISDLLIENSFKLRDPESAEGPYQLALGLQEERLLLTVVCTKTAHSENLRITLNPLKRHIQDYIIICDNFHKTARAGEYHRLEAIDAGRRSVHNEAAETLVETLENKVILDKMTARRLFSLLYVLHMRNAPTL